MDEDRVRFEGRRFEDSKWKSLKIRREKIRRFEGEGSKIEKGRKVGERMKKGAPN